MEHKLTMKVFIFISLLICGGLAYNQSDYHLEFERTELARFNKSYMTNVKLVTYKYNRTQPAVNASFTAKINFGNDVQGILQAYTFLSNEYRTFPLRYQFDLCDAINKDDYGLQRLVTYGNFTGCPMNKGTYYIYNWIPDSSKFPPFIPNGRYMGELQIVHSSVEMVMVRAYGIVSRPLGRRH